MSNREIQFFLTLKDEATQKWNQFHQTVQSQADKLKNSLSSLGGIITSAFAIGALKKFSEAADENQEALMKTDALLKSTGDASGLSAKQIEQMARQFSDMTGVQKDVVQEAENVLLTFTAISGKTFPDVMKTAFGMQEVLGTDLTGAVKMLGRALSDPEKGMNALRKVGIVFTQEQKDTIKSMQQGGDAAGAQAFMLNILETKFGPVTDAMKNMGRVQKEQVNNALHESEEQVGMLVNQLLYALLPVLKLLAERFGPAVVTIIHVIQIAFAVVTDAVVTFAYYVVLGLNKIGLASDSSVKYMSQLQESAENLVVTYGTQMVDSFKETVAAHKDLDLSAVKASTGVTKLDDSMKALTKGSQAWYDKQVGDLNDELKNLTVNSDAYITKLAEIVKLQNALKAAQDSAQNALKAAQDSAQTSARLKIEAEDRKYINTQLGITMVNLKGIQSRTLDDASAALELQKTYTRMGSSNSQVLAKMKSDWIDQHQYIIGPMRAGIASWAEGLKGAAVTWNTVWQNMKSTLIDWLADYVAQWATTELARIAIGEAGEATSIASAAVTGSAIAAAYLPAATLTSIATFGAADVAASAGMGLTFGVAKGLSLASKFHDGGEMGYFGNRSPLKDDERSAVLKVGETVRTKKQEADLNKSGGGHTFNFDLRGALISNEEGFMTLAKKALEKSGFKDLNSAVTNTRKGYSFGTV